MSKRIAGKERSNDRKNREITEAFVEDLLSGVDLAGIEIARVTKAMGGGRMELVTLSGKTISASLKGSLRCSKGASKRPDNPLATFAGSLVLLQETGYGHQIAGVLHRVQIKAIEKAAPPEKRVFFAEGGKGDDGFDWDLSEETAAFKDELDIDAI